VKWQPVTLIAHTTPCRPSYLFCTSAVFDNVDIDDIARIALAWEQKWGFIRGGDIAARERRWQMGNSLTVLSSERIGELAKELVDKARENSLDPTLDSPFALLAKDNDIMWSGGEPAMFEIPLIRSFHIAYLTHPEM
jgi:protein phosphatase PTC7